MLAITGHTCNLFYISGCICVDVFLGGTATSYDGKATSFDSKGHFINLQCAIKGLPAGMITLASA